MKIYFRDFSENFTDVCENEVVSSERGMCTTMHLQRNPRLTELYLPF